MEKPTNRFVEREFVLGGITAGLIGGLLMALLEMGIAYSNGHGLFAPLVLIDDALRGTHLYVANRGAQAFIGFLIHMAISGCLGGVFAIGLRLVRRLTAMVDALWAGLAFGMIVWGAVRNQILLPFSDSDIGSVLSITPEKWFLAHLVFGAALGLTPVLAKLYYRGEAREEEEQKKIAA